MYKKKLYYKIGEVCEITKLKPSIIRFWEKEFSQLKPVKFGSNHRYYTNSHLETILEIKNLLYVEKMTIEGAKKKLYRKEVKGSFDSPNEGDLISDIKSELSTILQKLQN